MLVISSLQNPRVKAALKLRERSSREEFGCMLVEGFSELSLAVSCGAQILELFYCPSLVKPTEEPLLVDLERSGACFYEVSRQVMQKLAYREHPDAWFAVAKTPKRSLSSLKLSERPLIVVAENLEKPGNLGAILRSADASGVDAVLVCDRATDVFNPNVVRASKGAVFQVPVVEVDSDTALSWLRENQIEVLAATPSASKNLWECNLSRGIAIAVGTEKEGLSSKWMNGAGVRVLIPMVGHVNSLNVAQAATLLVYEALRQRSVLVVSKET